MGIYAEQILPRVQDKVMDRAPMREIRARVCSGLEGAVVEVGFGTGLNCPFYPSPVERILAVEPSSVCMRIAQPRIAASGAPVELAGAHRRASRPAVRSVRHRAVHLDVVHYPQHRGRPR